ncbi:hypothetical protein BX616_010604 [Lobosporangium transversale]|uniref:Uncharacterized protein n=1 Tax=Lobosporangium transversale TaxID=64571 RepID=A0A1Y2GE53_9FUNG|nr:hypothetical protein BCR41DRAFT_424561 [Lobosporangium transversale]KAF9911398.1 hypothetical protein BX616_010604 [Lobosporangium transversale]ORZ08292.1 hypothetical protein BCR41DRAFT_424561 [Lobosporangium transversale]|eukprot:XP_021878375.1 hypothetical protein BCR41DRAFT_424561 [Lobosporangium transversale]
MAEPTPVTLEPACVVTDGTSLYALAIGTSRTTPPSSPNDAHYVLVKSNPNPSPDLSDISWTPVSVIRNEGLNDIETPDANPARACHIDETSKVFTVLSSRSRTEKTWRTYDVARGIQYRPSANGGPGSWVNVTVSPVSPDFEWGDLSTELYKPKGSENLLFASADPHAGKIWIASMDPSTLIMKQNPTP